MTFSNFNTISATNPLNTSTTNPVFTIFANRAPATTDNSYQPGTEWQDTSTGLFYKLQSTGTSANWVQLTGLATGVNSVTGTGPVIASPTSGDVFVSLNGFPTTGLLLGNGSGAITSISSSTDGQIPIASSGGPPAFASVNSSSGTIQFAPGSNSLSVDLVTPVTVSNGGTGDTSFTAYAPICGGTTSTQPLQSASTGQSNSGYVLTSTGSASLPTFQPAPSSSFNSAFLYYCSTASSGGVTGNGAQWGLGNQNSAVFTQAFDLGSEVSFPGNIMTFSPANSGYYQFNVSVELINMTTAMSNWTTNLAASVGGTILYSFMGANAGGAGPLPVSQSFGILLQLSAASTVIVEIQVTGGASNAANLNGHSFPAICFSGERIA